MLFYLLTATILAVATVLALWTAMAWPHPRADVTAGVLGAASVAVWSVFNNAHPGPAIGSLPFTLADLASLPALLVSSLLVGRTMLLRNHPFTPLPAATGATNPTPDADAEPDAHVDAGPAERSEMDNA